MGDMMDVVFVWEGGCEGGREGGSLIDRSEDK